MIDEKNIMEKLREVMHPAINASLVSLGIIVGAKFQDDKIEVEVALPGLEIPIKSMLLDKIKVSLSEFSKEVNFEVREMSEKERAKFLSLEGENWKGLD